MKGRLWGAALAALVMLQAVWSEAFEGRLLGPNGKPLAHARISVVGHPGTALSDGEGRFVLTPDPAPPFQLMVTQGDKSALRPIEIEALPKEEPLQVQVTEEMNDSITVVGGLIAELEVAPAAAVTLVGRGDLEQRTPGRVHETLKNVPGANQTEQSASAVPSLRGLASGRTLILLDEGRVTAERRAGPSASYLNPETLEAVEVIRGPGSVAYGSDAFGGVIRAISRQPQPGSPMSARLSLSGATGANEGSAAGEFTMDALGGGLLAGFHMRKQDDYDSPDGEVFNSSAKDYGARLGFQRAVGPGSLHVGFRMDRGRDVEKPDSSSRTEAFYYPEENSNRLHAAYQLANVGSFSEIEIGGFWDAYQLVTDRERFATDEVNRRIREADVDANDYGLRVEVERKLASWGSMKFGIDANGRVGLHAIDRVFNYDESGALAEATEAVTVDSANRHDLAAFAGIGSKVGSIQLSGGLRADQIWTKNKGGYFGDLDTSNASFSGFVAASWSALPTLNLSLQASRGFRDPTLSDRYFRGVSGRGFTTGNPDLKPESSRQFDAAVRWTRDRSSVAVFGYLYRIEDLVERYADGSSFFFRNRGEAENRGLELEAYLDLTRELRFEVGAQTARGEVLDDGTPTDNVPATSAFVLLRSDPARRWWWLARAAIFARDKRPGPTEIETPAYATIDAGLGYRLSDNASVQLQGVNLLDKGYPSGADAAATTAPGRNFQATLRFSL